MIDFDLKGGATVPGVTLKVLGIGGAGSNMVNSMIQAQYESIEYIVANTDNQALKASRAQHKIQLGAKATKGLGCGANPEIGKRSAEEDLDKIVQLAKGADVLFLVAGMGGGTGSGAMPVIANALKGADVLTIALVTKPFIFEGKRRMRVAQEAIEQLQKDLDTLLVIPNQKLLDVVDNSSSMLAAFEMINELLGQSVKSIADIISKPGLINVDFADLRTVMKDRGKAVMATGRATGNERAKQAAMRAISSPLLENMSIDGARGVLLNVTGSSNLGIHEISDAASLIYEAVHEDANIILGSVIDDSLGDDIVVTVIATGFEQEERQAAAAAKTSSGIIQAILDRQPAKVSEIKKTSVVQSQQVNATQETLQEESVNQQREAIALSFENSSSSTESVNIAFKKEEDSEVFSSQSFEKSTISYDPKDLDAPTYLRKHKEKSVE